MRRRRSRPPPLVRVLTPENFYYHHYYNYYRYCRYCLYYYCINNNYCARDYAVGTSLRLPERVAAV